MAARPLDTFLCCTPRPLRPMDRTIGLLRRRWAAPRSTVPIGVRSRRDRARTSRSSPSPVFLLPPSSTIASWLPIAPPPGSADRPPSRASLEVPAGATTPIVARQRRLDAASTTPRTDSSCFVAAAAWSRTRSSRVVVMVVVGPFHRTRCAPVLPPLRLRLPLREAPAHYSPGSAPPPCRAKKPPIFDCS